MLLGRKINTVDISKLKKSLRSNKLFYSQENNNIQCITRGFVDKIIHLKYDDIVECGLHPVVLDITGAVDGVKIVEVGSNCYEKKYHFIGEGGMIFYPNYGSGIKYHIKNEVDLWIYVGVFPSIDNWDSWVDDFVVEGKEFGVVYENQSDIEDEDVYDILKKYYKNIRII